MSTVLSEFTRTADTVFALRFLRLLTMRWEQTGAFEQGIIDNKGKLLKKPKTAAEKEVYTVFHKLVYNIKRLINKLPFGQAILKSYIAALFLIKDHTQMSDDDISKVLKEVTDEDIQNITLVENSIFINKNSQLIEGTYTLNKNLVLPLTGDDNLVLEGSEVIVKENCEPYGSIFNIPVFKVYHPKTKHYVFVTQEDITDE